MREAKHRCAREKNSRGATRAKHAQGGAHATGELAPKEEEGRREEPEKNLGHHEYERVDSNRGLNGDPFALSHQDKS
eukprot:1092666-Pyramimonas_sp.AAC.1